MLYPQKKQPKTISKRATLMIAAVTTGLTIGSVSVIFADQAHASSREPASSYETVQSEIVRYGDLDLASEQGRTALDRRIRRAAKQVCSVTAIPIIPYSKTRKCAHDAHSRAWAVAEQRISRFRVAVSSAE
jgi:UrcA family protein